MQTICKRIVMLSLLFSFIGICEGAALAQPCAPNAPCDGKIAPATMGNLPVGSPDAVAGTGWQMEPVYSGGFTLGVVLGDGRGDGVVRLYATQITTNTIKELEYDGSWTNTSNINLPFYSEGALTLGDARGNGSPRLYAGEFNFGGNTSEFTWNGDSWAGTSIGAVGQQLLGAVLGDAVGDGGPHLYMSTGSAPPNQVSYQYTFDGAAWTRGAIPSPFAGTSDGTLGIAVADGRNDAVLRIYQGVFDADAQQHHVYEFSWNGASWDASRVSFIGSGPPAQVMGVAVDDARNDGVNRVYALVRSSGIREFTYDGTAWIQSGDIPIGPELFSIHIGAGRNDGTNRIYVAELSPSRVIEATFDGTTWQTPIVASLSAGIFRVRVGDARGDGVNRVYSSGQGGVTEFTHP